MGRKKMFESSTRNAQETEEQEVGDYDRGRGVRV